MAEASVSCGPSLALRLIRTADFCTRTRCHPPHTLLSPGILQSSPAGVPRRGLFIFFYKLHMDELFVHTRNHKSCTSKDKKMFKFFFSVFLLSPPWALLHPVSEPTFLESRPPRVCLECPQNQNPGPRPVIPFPTAQVPKRGCSRESPGGLDEHTDGWAPIPQLLNLELSGSWKGPVHLPSSMFPKDADAIGAKGTSLVSRRADPCPSCPHPPRVSAQGSLLGHFLRSRNSMERRPRDLHCKQFSQVTVIEGGRAPECGLSAPPRPLTLQAAELPRAALPRDVLPVGAAGQGHHGAQGGGPLAHLHLELHRGGERNMSATPGAGKGSAENRSAGSQNLGAAGGPSAGICPRGAQLLAFAHSAAPIPPPAGNTLSTFLQRTSLPPVQLRQSSYRRLTSLLILGMVW